MTIKAIVCKTTKLKETKQFFQALLKAPFAETSPRHFVLDAGGIRLVFMDTAENFSIEIYLEDVAANGFRQIEDPNGIKVIIGQKY